jgi:hypothetical protein
MDIERANAIPEGWQLWQDWHREIAPDDGTEIKALEADRAPHQTGQIQPDPLKIGSGDCRVYTTFATELKVFGQADAVGSELDRP